MSIQEVKIQHILMRLDGGGHGQAMFKILKKAHIGYTIIKTYPNGGENRKCGKSLL